MKRIALAVAAIAVIAFGSADKASAVNPSGYPFFPFGFYQPYGAQYGNSIATPPHFSINPPVYYGARHSRPYGMSPFASPPMAQAAGNYRGRMSTDFYLPESEYEVVAPPAPPAVCNPCVSNSKAKTPMKVGIVRSNPFVAETQLAKN